MILDLLQRPTLRLGQHEVQPDHPKEVDASVEQKSAGQRHAVLHVQEQFVGDRRENVTDRAGGAGGDAPHVWRKNFTREDPWQHLEADVRAECRGDHEARGNPSVPLAVDLVVDDEEAVDGDEKERESRGEDREEGDLALAREVDDEDTDYRPDDLGYANDHRRMVSKKIDE